VVDFALDDCVINRDRGIVIWQFSRRDLEIVHVHRHVYNYNIGNSYLRPVSLALTLGEWDPPVHGQDGVESRDMIYAYI
jgi:hypothetical protein